MKDILPTAASLSDVALLVRVKVRAADERQSTAALLEDLGEIEERQLFLAEGCASLFAYCTEVLHFSEQGAYRRMKAARMAKQFPVILEKLSEGSINLTTVLLLAPYLSTENHLELLEAARHKSRIGVEELVARIRPLPPVPSSIRRMGLCLEDCLEAGVEPGTEGATGPEGGEAPATLLVPPSLRRSLISPLAPDLYRIQFTASAATYQKLRQVQELLRHQIPSGDPSLIVDRALTLLLDQLERRKLAAVDHPKQTGSDRKPRAGSRHIPAAVKREVWKRDDGRCAFVGRSGRRCSERGRLEFHHVEPYMLGGPTTTANIELRCRAHNAYEGMLVFGPTRRDGTVAGDSSADASPDTSTKPLTEDDGTYG